MSHTRIHGPLPRIPLAILRALLPLAERQEILADLHAEFAGRAAVSGRLAAQRWLWGQAMGSVPALLRRSWWRGWSGFEPRANAMNPGGTLMERWIMEVRYAARRLRKRPTYTALAVLTLALGVGGTAAISGIVRSLLLDPLPYRNERELLMFWNQFDWTGEEFTALRPQWTGFSTVAAYRPEDVTLERKDAPTRLIPGIAASAELFDVLGVPPLVGRGFQAGDDVPGTPPKAVISYSLWRELGGDRDIVGRQLRLDGLDRTVIGVMPPGFWFPDPSIRVWVRGVMNPQSGSGQLALIGRVAPGQDPAHMEPAANALTRRLGERWKYPAQWDKTKNARFTPLREFLIGGLRPALLATLAAMSVILLIACANVAALMLGQVESRSTELAVRSALGADRGRLTTQLVTEALAIGVLAALLGAGLATAGFNVLRGALSLGAWGERASLDWTVFGAAIVAALLGAMLVAFLPALSLWRGDLRVALGGVRTGGVIERRGGIQGMLVVGEVALAVLLAAGAALLVRSVSNLYAIRPGIDTHGIAVLDIALPAGLRVPERLTMLRRLLGDLSALPGVRSAALTHKLPLRGGGSSTGLVLEGDPEGPPPTTFFRIVSPGYFETLGIPLRDGRLFNSSDLGVDTTRKELTVIINESLAKKYFPNRNPVGQRIVAGMGTPERIVGVVGDVAEAGLTDAPAPARYFVNEQILWALDEQTIVIRTTRPQDALAILDAASRTLRSSAPSFALQEATTIERVFDRAVGPARQVMSLLTLLTALALVLSAIGIYGVIAHFVARRRRDWSIRVALGLAPSRVVRQVVGHSSTLVASGIVLGLLGAVMLARLLGTLLYGVGSADPASLVGVAVMLLAVGALAALLPALRASRSDPAMVMRET